MKRYFIIATARILLGLIFLVFGLNGFFLFITPPEHTPVGEDENETLCAAAQGTIVKLQNRSDG